MTARFEHFLERAVARFVAGDLHGIAASATIPLAVHVEEAFISFLSREALVRALEIHRRYLRAIRVDEVRGTLTALELPRHQRFRAWVEFHYYVAGVADPATSKAIFYGRDTDAGPALEMVQYLTFAHPRVKRLIPSASWSA